MKPTEYERLMYHLPSASLPSHRSKIIRAIQKTGHNLSFPHSANTPPHFRHLRTECVLDDDRTGMIAIANEKALDSGIGRVMLSLQGVARHNIGIAITGSIEDTRWRRCVSRRQAV